MGQMADDWFDRHLEELDPRAALRALMPDAFDYLGREELIAEALTLLNQPMWRTRDGRLIAPQEMSDQHRRNARSMLVRKLRANLAAQGVLADAARVVSLTQIGQMFDRLSPEEGIE